MGSSNDYVYLNGLCRNTGTEPLAAEIDDSRAQPIIEVPEEWDMAVVRFDLDTSLLPSSKLPMMPRLSPTQTFDTTLTVTMGSAVGRVYALNTQGTFWDLSSTLVQMYYAFQAAFADLPPATQARLKDAPQLVWINNRLRLIYPDAWEQFSGPDGPTPDVHVSFAFAEYLYSIPMNRAPDFGSAVDGRDARIKMRDPSVTYTLIDRSSLPVAYKSSAYGVGGDLSYLEQVEPNPGAFSAVRGIVLTTSSIPVQSEIVPTSTDSSARGFVSYNSATIISDYLLSPDSFTDLNRVVYLPEAEFRMEHLLGREGIRRVAIQAFWTDHYGNRYPVMLGINSAFGIKILFRRR
jgi:hypothetical protein